MELKINDRIQVRTVKFFNSFSMNLSYDSVASTFAFNFYFDPLNPDMAEMACVSHYHEAQLYHNGELLVTGYIISQVFQSSAKKEMAQFGGYSLTGVLEDCQIPISIYPLESQNLTLKEIAQKVIKPFKLSMVVDPAVEARMNQVYTKSTASESQSIKDYLTELASQRNIIISHTAKGELLFTEAKPDLKPILHIEKGLVGVTMSMSYSGQGLHSEITVMKQASDESPNAGQATVLNPYCPIVYRPKVIIQSSGDDNSTLDAANAALAAELKNIVLTVKLDRWEIDGKIIKPNNLISILNPDLYIYKRANFFIQNVAYSGDKDSMTCTLTCVLPEVYNNKTPNNIFVDKHKNTAIDANS